MSDSEESANILSNEDEYWGILVSTANRAYTVSATHQDSAESGNVANCALYKHRQQTTQPAIKSNKLIFPEATLSLVIKGNEEVVTFETHTSAKKLFVILTQKYKFFTYGVIMQIIDQHRIKDKLHIRARSQQLCRLVRGREIKHIVGDIYQVTVEALVDRPIVSPIDFTQLYSLQRYRQFKYKESRRFSKYRQYHLGQFPLPGWVYDMNEASYLMNRLVCGLSNYYEIEFLPKSPVQLSYWFAQNFLLTNKERMEIMDIRMVNPRLKQELNFLKIERMICCAICSAEIAHQKDVFPMPRSKYRSPVDSIWFHLTVSKATNFNSVMAPEFTSSWFLGYTLNIMQCKTCGLYVGWEFLTIDLDPKEFYGLAKTTVKVKNIENENVEAS